MSLRVKKQFLVGAITVFAVLAFASVPGASAFTFGAEVDPDSVPGHKAALTRESMMR